MGEGESEGERGRRRRGRVPIVKLGMGEEVYKSDGRSVGRSVVGEKEDGEEGREIGNGKNENNGVKEEKLNNTENNIKGRCSGGTQR